jgi:RNA polymerase sigma-70 factor (ECF subfamily)
MPDPQLPTDIDSDPARTVEFEQRFEAMGLALEKVSPRAYATLVMHRRDGMPLKQIAGQMGVSDRMVKRYLAMALSFCRRHLDDSA